MPWGKLKLGAGGGLQKDETVATKAAAPPSIHSKVRHNRLEEVAALLQNEDANKQDKHGNTPMHIACQNGHMEIIKVLIQHKANVNARNGAGNTPLHFAFGYKYVECGDFLRANGADDSLKNEDDETCYEIFKEDQEATAER